MQAFDIQVRWENPTNHRYYAVSIHPDLLNNLMLTKAWGSKLRKSGNVAHQCCNSQEEAIHQERLKHGYQLVQQLGITSFL